MPPFGNVYAAYPAASLRPLCTECRMVAQGFQHGLCLPCQHRHLFSRMPRYRAERASALVETQHEHPVVPV